MTEMYHSKKYAPKEAGEELTLESYLQRKYRSLGNDFRMEDGVHSDSCTVIAFDIAFSLLEAGKSPTVGSISGRLLHKNGWVGNEALIPIRYEGRVEFGGHTVCVDEGKIYDPMVSVEPLPLDDYLSRAFFNQTVEVKLARFSTSYIKDRLNED